MPFRIAAATRLAHACSRLSSTGASAVTFSRAAAAAALDRRPPRLTVPFPPQLPLGRLHSMSTASASGLSSGTSSSAASSASPAPAPSTSPRPGSSPSPLAAAAGAAVSTATPTAAVETEADGTKNTAVAESNHSDSSKVADSSAPEHSSPTHKPLPALPSPEDAASTSDSSSPAPRVVQVNGQPVALDALGPMVVGRDGTVSRIANWPEMTSHEREATLRVLGKRNQLRLANLRAGLSADQRQNSGEGASS